MAETNKMLIDATHPEETRVVVLRGGRVEEFDYESAARKQLRGNIYLAKVTRVEPSLQAAFVDYGGNRHGFLAFNEIHPDYYQIPVADRQALIEEEAAAEAAEEAAAEARAEARARREAQRAAAKARRRAEQSAAGEARDDDDEDLDGSDDADEDGDDEVVDINAEGSGLPADASSEGLSDDEDHNEHEDRETTFGAAADETNDEASKPSTIAEASGLDDDERHSEPLQQAQADSQPAAGAPESPVVEAGDAAVAEEELDREAPVPHGLVEDQGVHEAAPETEAEPTNGDAEESVEQVGSEDAMEELPSRPRRRMRSYKIQEVIKRRQVVLVQVVKEERGNKGAALTTYLSLAGRYTVLMPNTARGGGISRKITQPQDRKRLKAIAAELDVPEGMGLIIRTAGASRTKQEIKRDFEYLLRLWESVRELTLQSTAPNLVYEEGNLIKRSIRDLYNKDVEEIIVAGDEAHREAKEFMRMLMPSHAKNVIHFKQPEPLFTRFQIERQLNAMFSPYVTLRSGGYLVINQTEALVAIDVNSGKATREFSIEETALVTNCEAAEEIARQLKLRDLAGLIVIDFIDMEEKRNNRTVERRLKEALKNDRARIQVGRISHFGLLEMSRQRLRTGVLEGSTSQCPHCQGTGIIRSVESVALAVLRGLEDAVMAGTRASLTAVTTPTVALYILNKKRAFINDMEARHGLPIAVEGSEKMQGANFSIEKGPAPAQPFRRLEKTAVNMDWGFDDEDAEIQDEAEEIDAEPREERVTRGERSEQQGERGGDGDGRRRRRRRRRGRRGDRDERDDSASMSAEDADDDIDASDVDEPSGDSERSEPEDDQADDAAAEATGAEAASEALNGDGNGQRRRRRRGRRGGRRNRERLGQADDDGQQSGVDDADESDDDGAEDKAGADTEVSAQEAAAPVEAAAPTKTPAPAAPAMAAEEDDHVPADEPGTAVPAESPQAASTNAPAETTAAGSNGKTSPSRGAAEGPRTPRGELSATSPKLERVVVAPDAPDADVNVDVAEAGTVDAPARKGWWQRRFGN